MPGIPDLTTMPPVEDGMLPANPFTALSFHFGMLLGVDDFETEQGYHLGKDRLHNAWLHREGVVWGFGVAIDAARGEARVAPGLALDAAGRELHLDTLACVSLGAWYEAHRSDPGFEQEDVAGGGARFHAHVVARFRACRARAVPALTEACEDAAASTAYSRIHEAVELHLRAGLAPVTAAADEPYRRLRVLFGVAAPGDDEEGGVAAERARIDALVGADRPAQLLAAFRRYAALDEIDLHPEDVEDEGSFLFPAGDDAEVVLGNLRGVTLVPAGGGWAVTAGTVEQEVRRAHVATRTLTELLLATILGGAPAIGAVAGGTDAGGPRVASVDFAGKTITIELTKPLAAGSISDEVFRVSSFGDARWRHIKVDDREYQAGSTTVKLTLKSDPGPDPLRLVVRGTGLAPLLGEDFVPLAGGVGGVPGSVHDGNDFVLMHRQGS